MRASIAATVICLSIVGLSGAADVQAAIRRQTNIPAQGLGPALQMLAKERNFQLVYVSEEINDLRTSGAVGEFTCEEALQLLLNGTGLMFRYLDEKTVTIVSVAGSAAALGQTAAAQEGGTTKWGMRLAKVEGENPTTGPGKGGVQREKTKPSSTPDEESEESKESLEEILVTGSRIARSGFDTPSPMMTIDAGAIGQSGFVSVGDVLLETPSIGVGIGTATRGANGASFVNLRGLGTNRSLTLVNGNRRVSGSSVGSAVDLNAIPASMIERIEVITGGSSAVYGADAVSGVVNIILKDDFEGLEVSASGGVSQEGGAENFAVSLHGGTDFANGRGSINFGASYSTTEPLLISERDYDIGAIALDNPAYTGSDDQPLAFLIQDWVFYTRPYSGAFTVDDTLYTYVDGGLRPVAFTPGYGEGIVDSGPNKDPQGWTFKDWVIRT